MTWEKINKKVAAGALMELTEPVKLGENQELYLTSEGEIYRETRNGGSETNKTLVGRLFRKVRNTST